MSYCITSHHITSLAAYFALSHTPCPWLWSTLVAQKQIRNLRTDSHDFPTVLSMPKEWLKTLFNITPCLSHYNYTTPVWCILMRAGLWHFKVSSRDVTIVKLMWASVTSRECSYLDRWQFQIWRFGDVKRTLGMQCGFTRGPSAAACPHTARRFAISQSILHWSHTVIYCGVLQWMQPYASASNILLLGAFAKLQKETISLAMSVCLSVCPYGFHKIWYLSILRKPVEEIEV
jgi:hypothetical protein